MSLCKISNGVALAVAVRKSAKNTNQSLPSLLSNIKIRFSISAGRPKLATRHNLGKTRAFVFRVPGVLTFMEKCNPKGELQSYKVSELTTKVEILQVKSLQ